MPGGQIQMTTRSGTNQFTGSLFHYFRNEQLDANDWFNNRNSLRRAPLRLNNFGGVLGGPVVIPRMYNGKNRTFFFFSYEGNQVRIPRFQDVLTPSQQARQRATGATVSYTHLTLPTN